MPTLISQILAYGLPILALVGPGIIKRDGQTPARNGQIAFAIVVFLGIIQAYAAGALGANPYEDFAAVSGIVTGMQAGPLKWLDQYLQSNVGLKADPITESSNPVVAIPQPIMLPDSTKTTPADGSK
jgi:hypothetical protein